MSALPARAPTFGDRPKAPWTTRVDGPASGRAALARIVPIRDADLTPGEVRSRHLERLSVLASPNEERFARITALASSLFGVPMSTVTLVDSDVATFAGNTGFADAAPTPRNLVFCDETVASGQPMVVEDATADPRFADLPLVTGSPYLRFYAGVPLSDDDGVIIGTFCLFDTVPRRLDRVQVSMLMQLASWARHELVDSTDMARAAEVQQSLLPTRTVAPDGYELAAVCRPTKGVGGDFFDHTMVSGRLFFTLVDVMGKGIGAALVAASVRALLRASLVNQRQSREAGAAAGETGLGEILTATDRLLRDDLEQTGTLVTGFLATLDPATGEVDWVDAGHGLAVIVRADGSSVRLAGLDLPLGLGMESSWAEQRAVLQPGDTLLVVSDGLFDLLGGTRESFDRIVDLVRADPAPDQLIERITELTRIGSALDDVTAVAVRRLDGPG
jgi:serine phosphatase RsbU (regulator of sigma subunit)